MNRADEYKYNVIQFLEAPYKDIADYVCVPTSWVQSRGPDDRKVRVTYPDEKSSDTERRVRKRKKKSEHWKSYLCVVKLRTDSYDEAKLYIQGLIPEMRNADNTISSAKVEETPHRCTRFADFFFFAERSARVHIMDPLELSPNSNNNHKCTTETILKRKASPEPDKEAHNKRFRVNEPDESDGKVAEPSSQAFELQNEDQLLTPEVPGEDTQEIPVKKSNDRNNTDNRPTDNPNPSEENHSLDPEILVKQKFIDDLFSRCMRELQTTLQVCISSLFTEAVNKFMNNVNMYSAWQYNCPIASPSKNTIQEDPELNETKRNDKKDDDDDDEDIQPLKNEIRPKRIKKVVLPPEYDENDSRWTLKYRKPAPGLVELMPHTGVYVKTLSLTNCKRLSKDCKTLARMLLTEIFTTSALSTCSWTGTRAKAFDRDGTNVRPGLNEHARTVLLNYVAERAEKEGWNNCENQTILNSMRNKMQEMRCKYES